MSLVSGNKLAITRDADTHFFGEVASGRCAQRAALMLPPNKMGGKFLKMYLLHFFGLVLSLLVVPAYAAPAFISGAVCTSDPEIALNNFMASFPRFDATTIVTASGAVFNPAGTITANINVKTVAKARTTTTAETFTLQSCVEPVTQLGAFALQDVLFAFAGVAIWAFGFQSGMHR